MQEEAQHSDCAQVPVRAGVLCAAPLRGGARLLLRLQGVRAARARARAQTARDIAPAVILFLFKL